MVEILNTFDDPVMQDPPRMDNFRFEVELALGVQRATPQWNPGSNRSPLNSQYVAACSQDHPGSYRGRRCKLDFTSRRR